MDVGFPSHLQPICVKDKKNCKQYQGSYKEKLLGQREQQK